VSPEDARMNILELVDLLASQRRLTMDEASDIHEAAGFLRVYDTALPQSWFERFWARTGHAPVGIVWCYDRLICGEPYAVTKQAHVELLSVQIPVLS
jgi:hypothetical protein